MNVTTLGLDIAKNVFFAHGVDKNGKVVMQRKLTRKPQCHALRRLFKNRCRSSPQIFPQIDTCALCVMRSQLQENPFR